MWTQGIVFDNRPGLLSTEGYKPNPDAPIGSRYHFSSYVRVMIVINHILPFAGLGLLIAVFCV
jgi:hypothetical protein